MIILAFPEKILLDFESAAINALRAAFPSATLTDCYFHLTQTIMWKVNGIGMKEDCEKNDSLGLALRCLTALAMVPSSDVTEVFLILADNMPGRKKMPELLAFSVFEHTYIRDRWRPGRSERYGSPTFPVERWNSIFRKIFRNCVCMDCKNNELHRRLALRSIATFFQCHHPILWTFIKDFRCN